MTILKTVLDLETGEQTDVEMTAEEEAAHVRQQQATAVEQAAEDARATKLSGARPGAGIITKLRDGTALTAPELQTVVRYLALRELREARG